VFILKEDAAVNSLFLTFALGGLEEVATIEDKDGRLQRHDNPAVTQGEIALWRLCEELKHLARSATLKEGEPDSRHHQKKERGWAKRKYARVDDMLHV
jgi:hypothetical protein